MKTRTARLLVSGHCLIFPPATSEKEKPSALPEHVLVTATPWRKGTQVLQSLGFPLLEYLHGGTISQLLISGSTNFLL